MSPTTLHRIAASEVEDGRPLAASLRALNNADAEALSWLEPDRLRCLVALAFASTRIGDVEAWLLAFDQDAAYDGLNFQWFRARYARFVYVDRIVVAPAARGRGHARRLYADLFDQARRAGHDRIVCEVNLDPPNPVSDAFHAALSFSEVGRATLPGGTKTVRYLSHSLARTQSLDAGPPVEPGSSQLR